MSRMTTQPRLLQVLILGMASVLALSATPSSSLPFDSRRLLERAFDGALDGATFTLQHWSNPEAPHFLPGLSFFEKFKLSVQSSNQRVATFSNKMRGASEQATDAALGPSSYFSPLYNEVFEYAMEISIGTPAHTFSAVADTGSDLVWVQCAGCEYCQPQEDPLFDPSKSSTYKRMACDDPLCLLPQDTCDKVNKTCDYDYSYGSGETVGLMSLETVTLTSTTATTTTSDNFGFGCDSETFIDLGGVDGLVGLGRGPQSFTSQLGSLYGNKFSYCLVSVYDSNTTGSLLLFGDAAVPTLPTQYTPMKQNPNTTFFAAETFYYIGLTGIKVNGVALDIPSGTFDFSLNGTGGVISDSGTTITYLTSAGYAPLLKTVNASITYPVSSITGEVGLDLCYDLSEVTNPVFPAITMVFEGLELALPSDNVFIGGPLFASAGNNFTYCMAFADSEDPLSIFGNIQQQNFQVLYDRSAQQYGFAPNKCDTFKL